MHLSPSAFGIADASSAYDVVFAVDHPAWAHLLPQPLRASEGGRALSTELFFKWNKGHGGFASWGPQLALRHLSAASRDFARSGRGLTSSQLADMRTALRHARSAG